ncbi:BadF/BadG/BcrA/BcrD ATPase family protein [uncultured Thalassospira sp.]|jgi:N-acetylglucosamine kinase|uniref:N-acetylglucosamine kinase n=1 Tax=uncultured Thalassospira sp. TaxID=404382 RepID=UPI0030DBB57F|tara:strand:+ start:6923 stop:7870 length:948 start_codon:yes stop_codon:yes gene_type:complete
MACILALDAGGTKTLLAIADPQGAVTTLRSGPSLDPTSGTDWPGLLREMVAPVIVQKGLQAAVMGMPFHDELKVLSQKQNTVAAECLPCPVLVQNDVRVAFDGAFAGTGGVLVLAGTGSMAWASLNKAGDPHFRIGGWGDSFGDEGSAYWIGRESLALVGRGLDRRNETKTFADAVLSEMSLRPDELIDWVYALENRRSSIAAIARITGRLAEAGDKDAQTILDHACDRLVEHADAATRLLDTSAPMRWSYAGGVFDNSYVLNGVRDRIGSEPLIPVLPPIGGALLRCAQQAGWNADHTFIEGLSVSLNAAFQSL